MSEVYLTPEARADLAEAATWYRQRSAQAAERFLLAVSASFSRVATNPTAHPVLDQPTGTRRALLRKFPYRVLYLVDGERVVVFAVMHQRRDDRQWRGRV